MYNSHFKKWGPDFDKNRKKGRGSQALISPRVKRTRPRRLSRPPQLREPLALPVGLQTPNCFEYLEAVIISVHEYASGMLLDGKWSWDTFTIIAPAETPDYSSAWQDISDQCFGASTLFARGCISEGMKTLDHVCEKLREVARSNSPGLLVKFWRIVRYFYKTSQLFSNLRILFHFLGYFRQLVHIFHPRNHPLFRLLDALVRVRGEHLLDTLRVAYRRTIDSMEEPLGETHAVIVHMWSNYLKYWNYGGLAPTFLIPRYRFLLNEAESQAGPMGENTIAVLHGFLYAAYYNAADPDLAIELSLKLFRRTKKMPCLQNKPTWSLATQGFALAMKVLGTLHQATNRLLEFHDDIEDAINLLARGDRECQTRSLMLADLFRD